MGSEIIFQLPFEANRTFATMLKELDTRKEELGIEQYGMYHSLLYQHILSQISLNDNHKIK